MHKLIAILILMAGILTAGTISNTGTLGDPTWHAVIEFTVPVAGTVTFQTWSWGGGVNGAGTTIPGGNFDPYLSLFSGTGAGATFLDSNDDGTCPPAQVWDEGCYDSGFSRSLPAGSYTVTVSVSGNYPNAQMDPFTYHTLGDGFLRDGAEWGSLTPKMLWALDISGEGIGTPAVAPPADLNTTPEPVTFVSGGIALGLLGLARWRRRVR